MRFFLLTTEVQVLRSDCAKINSVRKQSHTHTHTHTKQNTHTYTAGDHACRAQFGNGPIVASEMDQVWRINGQFSGMLAPRAVIGRRRAAGQLLLAPLANCCRMTNEVICAVNELAMGSVGEMACYPDGSSFGKIRSESAKLRRPKAWTD